MKLSEIRSLYRDENRALRTVIKRIWEEWDADEQLWRVDRVEILYRDNYSKPEQPIEYQHGWIIPPEWEFVSEVWVALLRSETLSVSATLLTLAGDKKNWDWKISIDKGHIYE